MSDGGSVIVQLTGIMMSGVLALALSAVFTLLFIILMTIVWIVVEISGAIAFLVLSNGDETSQAYP